MQQLLLRVAVLMAVASTSALAQSSGGMDKKHDAMSPMSPKSKGMSDGMSKGMPDGMSHGMGAMLSGVDGHSATGGVMVVKDGDKATVSLDSTFSVADAKGAGLYLSAGDMFDMKAVRVAPLAKTMGKQSYSVRLPKGTTPQYLLIVNEMSHAVLAKAALDASMK